MTSSSPAVSKRKMVVQGAGTYQAWLRIKAAQGRTRQGRRETMRQDDEDHSGQGVGTLSGGRGRVVWRGMEGVKLVVTQTEINVGLSFPGGPPTCAGRQTPGWQSPLPGLQKHRPHIQQMHPKLELKLRKKEKGRAREKSWCQELMDPSLLRQDLSYTSSSGQARCMIWTHTDTHTHTQTHTDTHRARQTLYHWLPPVS